MLFYLKRRTKLTIGHVDTMFHSSSVKTCFFHKKLILVVLKLDIPTIKREKLIKISFFDITLVVNFIYLLRFYTVFLVSFNH